MKECDPIFSPWAIFNKAWWKVTHAMVSRGHADFCARHGLSEYESDVYEKRWSESAKKEKEHAKQEAERFVKAQLETIKRRKTGQVAGQAESAGSGVCADVACATGTTAGEGSEVPPREAMEVRLCSCGEQGCNRAGGRGVDTGEAYESSGVHQGLREIQCSSDAGVDSVSDTTGSTEP